MDGVLIQAEIAFPQLRLSITSIGPSKICAVTKIKVIH